VLRERKMEANKDIRGKEVRVKRKRRVKGKKRMKMK
jgi:hypothetical protein